MTAISAGPHIPVWVSEPALQQQRPKYSFKQTLCVSTCGLVVVNHMLAPHTCAEGAISVIYAHTLIRNVC